MTKKKIQLVISDIDGTFVIAGEKSLPTKAVIDAVNHLQENNVTLCLATGRALRFVENILSIIPLKSNLILNGGSEIYNLQTKKYVWKKNLLEEGAKKVLKYAEEKGYKYGYYEDGVRFNHIRQVKHWCISKIAISNLNLKQINNIKRDLHSIPDIHVVVVDSWKDKNLLSLNITHAQATKQYAIFELLKIMKINRKNVLGIGDRENDLPLLAACGVKVAMGNADKNLKEVADWVAPPVWEDGFAVAMEKFVI